MKKGLKKKPITVCDVSLRDGNHAINHQMTRENIARYCQFAESAGIPYVEVGHGNGLGASSLLIGESLVSDEVMLTTAKTYLTNTKLGVHVIPGFATIGNHIKKAIDWGADVFRIASHCTEANMTKVAIEFLRKENKTVHGVLMMTALAEPEELLLQAKKMEDYGAEAVIIMDSTGSYLPNDVKERIDVLVNGLGIKVGFHAHNNLGCAVANSLVAAERGAVIIDACIHGFGAGAGNTPLEIILPVLESSNFETNIDFDKVILEVDSVTDYMIPQVPITNPINIQTGLNKLFSGFSKRILKAAALYEIPYTLLVKELGNRKLVAGQEDLITEVALAIKQKRCQIK